MLAGSSCAMLRRPAVACTSIVSTLDLSLRNPLDPIVVDAPSHRLPSGMVRKAASSCAEPEERLRAHVEALCSPLCMGRAFGSAGSVEASRYVFEELRECGLEPRIETFRVGERIGRNVLATIPGKGPKTIVIMAYYDGLGTHDGRLYPGADANASGVAVLLELARTLSRGGQHNILLAAVDGHAVSMEGAKILSASLRRRDVDVVVNLDVIGSSLAPIFKLRKDYLICLGGSPFSPEMYALNNAGPGLHITFDYYGSRNFTNLFYRSVSDHRYFLEKGMPCVMFTSGITYNINKPQDTPETLDYIVLERRIRLIRDWLEYRNTI